MSNSKKTMKGEFGNVYGPGKNLNVGKNKSTQELLNNIPNTNLNSDEIIKNSIDNSRKNSNSNSNSNEKSQDSDEKILERKESLGLPNTMTPTSSPFKLIYIILIIIVILIITLLFFYKDTFILYFDKLFLNKSTSKPNDNAAVKAAASTSAKVDNTAAKVDVTSAKVESTSAKIDDLDKKVDKLIDTKTCPGSKAGSSGSGISTLNNKLNNISPYKEANVTENGYCYIGYDNGQRECVDVYPGAVCMSGEIFPSLDICINPKLRP
jgi:hypothetical protein